MKQNKSLKEVFFPNKVTLVLNFYKKKESAINLIVSDNEKVKQNFIQNVKKCSALTPRKHGQLKAIHIEFFQLEIKNVSTWLESLTHSLKKNFS
jgi:hypothetical protein